MTALVYLYLVAAFAVGGFAAYMDLDSFFRSKKAATASWRHPAFYGFICLNGAISAGMLLWSMTGDKNSVINQIIQVESGPAKTLIIAFAVPSLLRSKLFGGDGKAGDDGNAAVGVAAGYDFLRDKVLRILNNHANEEKDRLCNQYANTYRDRSDLPDKILEWVKGSLSPFSTERAQEAEQAFSRMKVKLDDPQYPFERYLQDLIRWAMDNAGIGPIQRRLKQLASPAQQSVGARNDRPGARDSQVIPLWIAVAGLALLAATLLFLSLRTSPNDLVLKYKTDITLLRATVEAHNPGWASEVQEKGPGLARLIGEVNEDQLKPSRKIVQHEYKGWALLMVAYSFIESTESETKRGTAQVEYASSAIREFDLALKRMDEVARRASKDPDAAVVYLWMTGQSEDHSDDLDRTHCLRATALAIVAQARGPHTNAEAREEMNKVTPGYLKKFNPESNAYLARAMKE